MSLEQRVRTKQEEQTTDWLQRGCEEHCQRPAPMPSERDNVVHVEAIDVWAFLSIDFDWREAEMKHGERTDTKSRRTTHGPKRKDALFTKYSFINFAISGFSKHSRSMTEAQRRGAERDRERQQ